MFVLDTNLFGDDNLGNAQVFVERWSRCYSDNVKVYNNNEIISYVNELNLDNNLTEENVKRLLRWKDPRQLTEIILTGPNRGQPNEKVFRVLEQLVEINQFRSEQLAEDRFREMVAEIFPNGFIWQVFLFHIAKPCVFPIADQNVFRAFNKIMNNNVDIWEQYINGYRVFFFGLATAADKNINDVSALKCVDNALFEFGKFLRKYDI
jgi:hypothetical protein